MRTSTLVTFGAILALLVLSPTVVAEDTPYACHTWEIYVGDTETGAGASTEEGALLVAAAGMYLLSDGAPVVSGYLFSLWTYQESNGERGLQRGDEGCDETDGGTRESDTFCFC